VQLEDVLKDVSPSCRRVTTTRMASMLMRSRPGWMLSRVPVVHRTGIFHPKNVFALVEESVPDDTGYRAQSLIVASMSAT